MSTTKKALLIGCNYSSDPANRLYGCINDVTNMANTLVDAFDYDLANITILRDDSPAQSPTRANILQKLNDLVNTSSTLTEIWFHYSGHGSQVKDTNGDEAEGLDEVIVPTDFKTKGCITDDEIYACLQKISPKCRAILLFDSCHSGSICDLANGYQINGSVISKYPLSNKPLSNPNIYCFSGCKDAQTSADAYSAVEARSVGAFTATFLYCLRCNHFNVDIMKLYKDICTSISASGFTQTPTFSSSSPVVPVFTFGRVSYRNVATISNPSPALLTSAIATGNNKEISASPKKMGMIW